MRTSLVIMSGLFALLAVSSLSASEEALNAVPVPPDAERRISVVNLLQNGRKLSIANLKSDASIDEVIGFYKAQWAEPIAESLPGFIVDTAGDWTIISRPTDKWHQVVQLRSAESGLVGRISVMELTENVVTGLTLPVPSNAALFSTTSARDFGTDSNTFTVVSKGGKNSLVNFYKNHFENNNWKSARSQELGSNTLMIFRKSGSRAEIVVSRANDGSSIAIINQVTDHD